MNLTINQNIKSNFGENMELARKSYSATKELIKSDPSIQEVFNELANLQEYENCYKDWNYIKVWARENYEKEIDMDKKKSFDNLFYEVEQKAIKAKQDLQSYKQKTGNYKSANEMLTEILTNLIK